MYMLIILCGLIPMFYWRGRGWQQLHVMVLSIQCLSTYMLLESKFNDLYFVRNFGVGENRHNPVLVCARKVVYHDFDKMADLSDTTYPHYFHVTLPAWAKVHNGNFVSYISSSTSLNSIFLILYCNNCNLHQLDNWIELQRVTTCMPLYWHKWLELKFDHIWASITYGWLLWFPDFFTETESDGTSKDSDFRRILKYIKI